MPCGRQCRFYLYYMIIDDEHNGICHNLPGLRASKEGDNVHNQIEYSNYIINEKTTQRNITQFYVRS